MATLIAYTTSGDTYDEKVRPDLKIFVRFENFAVFDIISILHQM